LGLNLPIILGNSPLGKDDTGRFAHAANMALNCADSQAFRAATIKLTRSATLPGTSLEPRSCGLRPDWRFIGRMPALGRQQKITLGEMRSTGLDNLLVYCGDYKCAHTVVMNADRWPDEVRLSDLEPLFVWTVCGHRGGDVRPLFDETQEPEQA
jgi:hypothetical protein